MSPSEEAIYFARAEFERIFIGDAELRSLCCERTKKFLPDGPAAAPIICDQIIAYLREQTPASLLRVGDGEGGALGMTNSVIHPQQASAFYAKFLRQNGVAIPQEDAISLCTKVRSALASADIVGFRSFRFAEKQVIQDYLDRGELNAGLNLLYARELLQRGLLQDRWRDAIITSAWIHLDLISHLGKIVDAARSIIVITGRSELRAEVCSRFGSRLEDFISVPVERRAPKSPDESHYFGVFLSVLKRLNQDLRGKLVLAGAGLFAKVYCHAAKLNGAVAIDLGSAFDILAGLETRPAHKDRDINALRWI